MLRLGVAACIATAVATAAVKLDDAIGVFDVRADRNAALTYRERTYAHPEWYAVTGGVLEAARLWMPERARYRVVFGPDFDPATTPDFSYLFLRGFLLPRRPTRAASAKWAFCYGCPPGLLGDRFEVLARAGPGFVFGRTRP